MKLDPQQCRAIELLCDLRVRTGLVTGGPGTGKTTVTRFALDELDRQGRTYLLAAPTGKAAKRMSEATGREAVTLHRLLNYRAERWTDCETCKRSSSTFNRERLDVDVVIVDEASMIDVRVFAELGRACKRGSVRALRFIGDPDQLPPVGPGQPFQDGLRALAKLPEREAAAVVRLGPVYRQGKGSWVAHAAPQILAGQMPDLTEREDFRFVEVPQAPSIVPAIEAMFRGEHDTALWSAEATINAGAAPAPVLIPQRTGPAGCSRCNRALAEAFNPADFGAEPTIQLEDGSELRRGAQVMAQKNDYARGVRNGDTGRIVDLETQPDPKLPGGAKITKVYVQLDDAPADAAPIAYTFAQAREQLQLSYAYTIHKSQGSQYPWIIVVCHSSHVRMLTRRLLYTGLTRAQQGVVLIGDRAGLQGAVGNKNEVRRRTRQVERMMELHARYATRGAA